MQSISTAAPGSAQGLYLVVSDIEAARNEFVGQDVEISEVFHSTIPGAQFTARRPGRIDAGMPIFASANDLASALRRAEAADAEHEKRIGQRGADWAGWYASYIVAEGTGKKLPV